MRAIQEDVKNQPNTSRESSVVPVGLTLYTIALSPSFENIYLSVCFGKEITFILGVIIQRNPATEKIQPTKLIKSI
ncbi:hypothetical protein Csa_005144 [Cucumis sativus]|nr:hypothetical protein Csa_005144 [Cucumis sativus]